MTQSPSASPCSTSHSTVPWAKSLMSRSTGDAPALDHHPGLAGRHEDRAIGRPRRPTRRSSSATDILPIAQSVPTVRIDPLARGMAAARRRSPSGPAAGGSRRSCVPLRRGGRRELRVVAEERVQAGQDVEAGVDRGEDRRPPRRRQLAAGRGDADQQRVGRVGRARASARRRDDRDVVAGQELVHVPAGLGRIEDRDDVVAAVADHAVRGLGVVLAEGPSARMRRRRRSVGRIGRV